MDIRKTAPRDLPALEALYAAARKFMAEHGNPHQWGDGNRPTRAQLEADIAAGKSYVCTLDGRIVAAFFFAVGEEEPSYAEIDGAWLNDAPYGMVHRIAAPYGVRGAASHCMAWCFARCGNLRIDTHRDNLPMQGLLDKLGYTRCGVIRLADGSERLAYQKWEGGSMPPASGA